MWALFVGMLLVVPVDTTPAPVPTVTVNADCASLVVTSAGWPDGSDGIVGFGSAPPQAAPVNDSWSYAPSEVAADQAWFVLLRGPGVADQSFTGTVSGCLPDPAPAAPVWVPPPVINYTVTPWVGVELAPPW